MANRLVDTKLWNDENIIENFTAEDRYFWLYLLTNPHNNICGVLKNSPALMARDMGLHKDTIINLLYRFENIHKLVFCDKETNEVVILNWSKYNWTKSPKILSVIEKELGGIKSEKIKNILSDKISSLFDKDTVSIGYRYPTNTITNNNTNNSNTVNVEDNKVSNEDMQLYFDKTYSIYPRKVSKVQARHTFYKKIIGLDKTEARNKALAIYSMLEQQIVLWKRENEGEGRKIEHIPHFSTWLSANVEDSGKEKRRK